MNLPLPAHRLGTQAFLAVWERLLPAVARAVRPDLLVVSAGFDYVEGDPVGDLGVLPSAATQLGALVNRTAQECCRGRVAYVLEGGYHIAALADSIGRIAAAHDARNIAVSDADPAAIPQAQARLLDRIVLELR